MTNEELLYIVKLQDELSSTAEKMRSELSKVTGEANNTGGAISGLKAKLADLASWAAKGFAAAFGFDVFQALRNGIDNLVQAIPNAIRAGDDYLTQLRQVQLESGLSAQATSTLAGVFGRLGIPIDTLDRTLAIFGKNLSSNEDLFHRLGVATRDANGNLLDAQTVLDNTRRAFNSMGTSLLATGAAQELFSRSGYQLLEYLQLSDAQVKQYTSDLSGWGLVVNQSVLNAAEGFNRAVNNLQQGIQGLQTNVFAALEPTLRSFVDSFANFIREHFTEIVTFVVNVTNFVLGVIGGLLGINFTPITMAEDQGKQAMLTYKQWVALQNTGAAATGGATSATDRQTKAIDAQIAAIRARAAARHSANQEAQLQLSLEQALAQLEDLKANSPFVAGLSNAEQQLALQKHQADLIAAQKAVTDAQTNLTNFGLDQRDQAEIDALDRQKQRLQAGAAAEKASANLAAGYAKYVADYKAGLNAGIASNTTSMFNTINAAAQSWRDKGVAFAGDLRNAFNGLLDTLFGPQQYLQTSAAGSGYFIRSGGLLGALGGFQGALSAIAIVVGASFIGNLLSVGGALRGIAGIAGGVAGGLGGLAGALFTLAAPVALLIGIIEAAKAAGAGAVGFNPLGFLDTLNKGGWNLGAKLPKPTTWQQALGLPSNFGGTSTSSTPPAPLAPPAPLGPPPPSGSGGSVVVPHQAVLASGGVVRARRGGTLALIGEGGQDEGVFTEDQLAMLARVGMGGGGQVFAPVFNFSSVWPPSLEQAREIMKFINRQLSYQAARQPTPLVAG